MSLGADVRVADLDAGPLKAPATIPSPTTGTWVPAVLGRVDSARTVRRARLEAVPIQCLRG